MFYKVQSKKALPNYILQATFKNLVTKLYDVKPLFDIQQPFKALIYTKGLFELVKVGAGGYATSWNNDIDLSCNELWENGFTKI